MASEMTVTLSGSESEVQFSGANAWLRNDGTGTIYAGKAAGVSAGADGVVAVPAGGSAPVYGANGRVFLLGTGSVQLIGSDYSANPFKTSAASSGSGADEVARAAIEAHAGNAEIHVTSAEKAAWDGKAEMSDIPTSLPADGGGFEFKSSDGTAKFEISENGIQLFRKNAANGYRAYIGADTYLTAYVEGSNSSVNAFLSSDSMSVGGSRYSIQSTNGMLYASAKDSEGTLCAQISINGSSLVINYGSIYRLYLSDGEFTVKANNSPLLSVTATGLYVNGKKVLTE